jgi:hypothetical protein
LRTPLVSILGAATVISQAPANRRLASLSDTLRDAVVGSTTEICSTPP